MAAADYVSVVQQLYVAYFGRPADVSGLANFTAALDATGVPATIEGVKQAYGTSATVKTLVDQFGTSTESANLYGSGTTESFVFAIYQNVLDRVPDAAGFKFWCDEIDAGRVARAKAALDIMAGAKSNTSAQGLIDAATVDAKIAVATNFTTAVTTQNATYSGDAAAATARAMLADVNNATDVTAFQATITSTLTTITNPNVGSTFTLTTAAEIKALSAKNDTVDAMVANSLEGDTIIDDGGTDVLNAKLSANLTAATTVTGVESINLEWDAFSTPTISASKITGAHITLMSSKLGYLGDANVTAAGANTIEAGSGIKGTLNVAGVTTGTVKATNAKVATVNAAGTASADDTVTVLAGATTTTINVGTGTAFDAATVTAGAATTAIDVRADKTATVTAAAATKTISVTSAAATVDATAAAADATITLEGFGTTDTATVTLGNNATVTSKLAGTEKLTLDVADGKTVTLTGLVGAETLEVKSAGAVTLKGTAANVTADTITKSTTGALTLQLSDTAVASTVDTAKIGADTIKFTAGTAAVVQAKSGQSFEVAAAASTSKLEVGTKTDGAADTLNVKLSGAAFAEIKNSANDIETLNITAAAEQATGAATAVDLTITDLIAGATNKVVLLGTNDVKVDKVTSAKEIDASGLNGTLNIGSGTAVAQGVIAGATGKNTVAFGTVLVDTAVTFVGQGGDDVVTLTAVNDATGGTDAAQANLVLGAGKDSVTVSGVVAGVLSVQAGEGDDTVTLSDSPTGTVVLEFGEGVDTLKVAAGKTYAGGNLTLTGLETIQLASTGTVTFKAATLSGQNYTVKGTDGAVDTITVNGSVAEGETIDLSGLTMTDSVATGLLGAIVTGNDGADTILGTTRNDEITAGKGADTINLSNGGNDTVTFSAAANNGKDTIVGFNAGTDAVTADILKVSTLATLVGSTTGGVDVALTATSTAKLATAAYEVIGIAAADKAAADWSNVATKISGALTIVGDTTAANANTVILIDNGTDTRVYLFSDDATNNTTVEASELTLVGTVSGVLVSAFDAANFA
ncbi:MAG TPA: DUF4214 domain-containing protein [Noviherbaspirillum sp.]|nr:DUF4214 domain-containing protein [Noviherbaspirillum sp.]